MLSLLDRLASCAWGCRGGDHVIEYLLGRSVGDVRGALQLMRTGYYDESLGLCRNVGETANLLRLFEMQPQVLEEWKHLDGRARWGRYRPKAVRDALGVTGDVLYSEERYSRVSELATHVTPDTRPQAHNPFGIPSQATIFQMSGLLIS
jgi:hypothetical protein